jgi:hypothetical protein
VHHSFHTTVPGYRPVPPLARRTFRGTPMYMYSTAGCRSWVALTLDISKAAMVAQSNTSVRVGRVNVNIDPRCQFAESLKTMELPLESWLQLECCESDALTRSRDPCGHRSDLHFGRGNITGARVCLKKLLTTRKCAEEEKKEQRLSMTAQPEKA